LSFKTALVLKKLVSVIFFVFVGQEVTIVQGVTTIKPIFTVILLLAPIVSIYIYFSAQVGLTFEAISFRIQPTFLVIHILTFILILYLFDQYNFQQDFRRKRSLIHICFAVTVAGILMVFFSYLMGLPRQGRWIYVIYCTFIIGGVVLVRIAYSILGSAGIYDKKTLIVGCGESGRSILDLIKGHPHFGLKVIGFLDNNKEKQGGHVGGYPVFWQDKDLKEAVREHKPQLLIMAMRRSRYRQLVKELIWCAQQNIEIWDVPTAFECFAGRIPLAYVDEMWLLFSSINWPRIHIQRLKRLMDVVLAGFGLLISLPIMTIAAILIKVDSPGPLVLKQKRIGKNGRIIKVSKFRTMIQAEPNPGEKGISLNDRRVTRAGRIIRRLHIDEIPQFINVLKGELSMVGPRAELFDFVYDYIGEDLDESGAPGRLYEKGQDPIGERRVKHREDLPREFRRIIPYIEQRFTVNQGITGWAQVMHPYVSSSYEDMVKKLEYDLYYLKNMSFFLDCLILLKTIKIVLLGRGK